MDEVDAIGGRRFSEGTSADREIQRTLMELLNQMDGFDILGKVRTSIPRPAFAHKARAAWRPSPHRTSSPLSACG